jgi:hypothetical protein
MARLCEPPNQNKLLSFNYNKWLCRSIIDINFVIVHNLCLDSSKLGLGLERGPIYVIPCKLKTLIINSGPNGLLKTALSDTAIPDNLPWGNIGRVTQTQTNITVYSMVTLKSIGGLAILL